MHTPQAFFGLPSPEHIRDPFGSFMPDHAVDAWLVNKPPLQLPDHSSYQADKVLQPDSIAAKHDFLLSRMGVPSILSDVKKSVNGSRIK